MNKQIELVSQLAEDLSILDIKKKYERTQSRIPISTQDAVINFYHRHDIRYQTPGRRNSITIKVNGIKQTLQKHFLLFSLREAYQLFVDENSQHRISRFLSRITTIKYLLSIVNTTKHVFVFTKRLLVYFLKNQINMLNPLSQ